jgi:putative transposase
LGLQVQQDPLHILISLKPKEKLSFVVQLLKGRTSRELRRKYSQLSKLPALWTPAYFVRSLGEVNTAQIKAYLDRQDDHHWVMRGSTKVR